MRLLLLTFLFVCHTSISQADIVVVGPKPRNHVPTARGADGDHVKLKPDPVKYLKAGGPEALRMFGQLGKEFKADTGWSFNIGSALNGRLNVDIYKARVPREHRLGAELEARYTAAANENPLNLRWVQLVDTDYQASPFIDPPGNENEPGKPPFYWKEFEHFMHTSNRTPSAFGNYDLHFYDGPEQTCRNHPDQWNVTFDLFLTSYKPTAGGIPGVVTIHDGIRWGYDAKCVPRVPEPSSWMIGMVGAVGFLLIRRPVRKRC